jgi:hypothetical protein
MPSLPPEIWLHVVRSLADDRDKQSLKSSALVSRLMRPFAHGELFRSITLHGYRKECARLRKLISSNPDLSKYTRDLLLIETGRNTGILRWLISDIGLMITSYFTHVTRLSLCRIDFRSVHSFVEIFSKFTSVVSLNIEQCIFNDHPSIELLLKCFQNSIQHVQFKVFALPPWFTSPVELCQSLEQFCATNYSNLTSLVIHVPWLRRSGSARTIRALSFFTPWEKHFNIASSLLSRCGETLSSLELVMAAFQGMHNFTNSVASVTNTLIFRQY